MAIERIIPYARGYRLGFDAGRDAKPFTYWEGDDWCNGYIHGVAARTEIWLMGQKILKEIIKEREDKEK